MRKRSYVVGGQTFKTKDDVEAEIHRILEAGKDGSDVVDDDRAFALDLLQLREDKLEAIGSRRILRVERGPQPGKVKNTRCLWVALDDGTRLDFSMYKAVKLLRPTGSGGRS